MNSDEETEDVKLWQGVPGTIILINLFGNSKYKTFPIAHDATCRVIRQHLRLSGSQNVSVCIHGIEEPTSSNFDSKSVVEVFPLTMPTLTDFKKLQDLDISIYPEAKEFKLSDVLWHCSKMFTNFKKKLSSRTLIMLTDLRVPPIATDQKPTFKRVMDLVDSYIDVKIINISETDYMTDPFYENFLIEVNKGEDFKMPQPIWDSKEIEKLMLQVSHRHLAVAKLNFEIGDGLAIGVGIYSLLKRSGQTQYKTSNLERDSSSIVTRVTKTMKVSITNDADNEDDGEQSGSKGVPLLRSEVLHIQEYGGRTIEFTDTEYNSIRNPFGPPMMKLLGFKPARIVSMEKWYFKMSYFLFPNENSIEGSTVAFKALHKACTEMSVVAICVLCTRVNSKPIIVALSPTRRPLGLDVDHGFDVIIIPFIENVRDISSVEESEESDVVDEANKSVMRDIIKSLRFDYKPDMFENPKLVSLYKALENIALQAEEDIDPFTDTTHPDPDKLNDIKKDLFDEIFGPFGAPSIKRTAVSSEPRNSKKTKVENIDEDLLKDRISTQTVDAYTVPQLKEILRIVNPEELPALTGLKKTQLVDLVYKYC